MKCTYDGGCTSTTGGGGGLVGVEVVVLFTRVTLVEALPPSCLVLVVSTSTVAWELCSVLDLVSSELCTVLVAGDDFLNCSIQKKKMEKVHTTGLKNY